MNGKILIVFGTRPEAIKMAPLVLNFKKLHNEKVEVCVTSQHREMLDQVLDFFEIIPDYDLNLMQPGQSLNSLGSRILHSFDDILIKSNPDWVFVHGDTSTSMFCAIAAFHRGIRIAHIEAGLRTYNKHSPFPEEINRQITGRLADLHFAPTSVSMNNLLKEGVPQNSVYKTGNTVIDALHIGLKKIENGYTNQNIEELKRIVASNKKIILVTCHRRENFGDGFENICNAIKEIALEKDVHIIYPVHLNPNVQEPVRRILGKIDNISLINPLDYPSFVYAMNISYIILTDSGGVQEEAPSLGKPVLLLRNNTERPEAVDAGVVLLVGTDKNKIIFNVSKLLENESLYKEMTLLKNPYGNGDASEKIIKLFLKSSLVILLCVHFFLDDSFHIYL
jgi:UDP-N-acetylglucosamine 2-epimerase (non-hydrolysing)